MEETQIKTNMVHHLYLALWCLWTTLIQPNIHIKASDTIYIWKIKLVECKRYLMEVNVRGVCAWSRF